METALKSCNKCGVVQPLDSFYQDRSRSDGRRRTCIACDKARKRTPEVHEQSHRYYHSEKGKAAERKYYHEGKGQETRKAYNDRPEIKEKRRARGSADVLKYLKTEKGKQWVRQYQKSETRRHWLKEYLTRPEVQERQKAARQKPERMEHRRAYAREYQQRTEVFAQRRQRYLQRHGIEATLTGEQWQATITHFDARCAYCGIKEDEGHSLEQDHFVCLHAGGPHSASNVVPACRHCNARKGNKPPEEWCPPETFERIVAYLSTLA